MCYHIVVTNRKSNNRLLPSCLSWPTSDLCGQYSGLATEAAAGMGAEAVAMKAVAMAAAEMVAEGTVAMATRGS